MEKRWTLDIGNKIPELTGVHVWIEEIRAHHLLGQDVIFAVTLALDELLTNTISYGYTDTEQHIISIEMMVDLGSIILRIDDDGAAFNPLSVQEPDVNAPLDERRIGGLGIHLVRNMLDDVQYQRSNGRNIITLRKRFART